MENTKYGECAKHPNNSMFDCNECAIECNVGSAKLLELTTKQKLEIVSGCNEILTAVKLLIALFEDNELKEHITLDYELNNETYQLSLNKLSNANEVVEEINQPVDMKKLKQDFHCLVYRSNNDKPSNDEIFNFFLPYIQSNNESELAKYKELDECNKCTIHNLKQTVSDLKLAMIRGNELNENLIFEGDDINNSKKLIKALKEYNQLLSDELDDSASMAFVHGWRSKRVEKGNELRERISKLEQII